MIFVNVARKSAVLSEFLRIEINLWDFPPQQVKNVKVRIISHLGDWALFGLAYYDPLRRDQVDGASSLFDSGHHTLMRAWFKRISGMTRATGWWRALSFHQFDVLTLTVIPWDSWERKTELRQWPPQAEGGQSRLWPVFLKSCWPWDMDPRMWCRWGLSRSWGIARLIKPAAQRKSRWRNVNWKNGKQWNFMSVIDKK